MKLQELKEKIKELSGSYLQDIIAVRRHLHANPELSFQEFETSEYIISKLKEYGIPYISGIAKTGVVGIISGKNPLSDVIAMRADIDALPIAEAKVTDYRSRKEGIMHACGHDVHTASLLGAARILNELKDHFEGTVKLFFQPAEEMFPGGALGMIADGALENPRVKNIIGQHVLPTLDAGKVGMKAGKYMASTDEVFITVKGKGGHAATPDLYINPIPVASTVILETVKEFNAKKPATSPSVLVFGKFTANGKTNIIPDEASAEGTLRAFDEQWRKEALRLIDSVASAVAEKMNASCEVRIANGFPFLVNDDAYTKKIKKLSQEYLGEENVVDLEMRMTAEDFAYFSQEVPSCFYRLGTRNEEKGIVSNLHTTTFDVDESCMITGMGLMAWIAVNMGSGEK